MRKSYTANFKTKQVLTLLREEKTISELASESGVHPNQLRNWRDLVLQQMDTLFEKKEETTQLRAAHEAERDELSAEIGRLSTQAMNSKTLRARQVAMTERLTRELKTPHTAAPPDSETLVFSIGNNVAKSFMAVRNAAGITAVEITAAMARHVRGRTLTPADAAQAMTNFATIGPINRS